jgi:hypothetical protein
MFGDPEVTLHLLTVGSRDQGAGRRSRVFWPSKLKGPSPVHKALYDFIEDRALDINPLCAEAHLPGIREHRVSKPTEGCVQIGISKHNRGVLST